MNSNEQSTNLDETQEPVKSKPAKSRSNIRQLVLIVILLLVAAAFLVDKYVLLPSAKEKINKVQNEVTMSLSDQNRQQVHDAVGRKPTNVFTYKDYDVEQYRFPRGLPFYPKPVLEVVYHGDAIVMCDTKPLTPALIELKLPKTKISETNRDEREPSQIIGVGAGG